MLLKSPWVHFKHVEFWHLQTFFTWNNCLSSWIWNDNSLEYQSYMIFCNICSNSKFVCSHLISWASLLWVLSFLFFSSFQLNYVYLNKRQIKIHDAIIAEATAETVFRKASSGVKNSTTENDERTNQEPTNNLKTNISSIMHSKRKSLLSEPPLLSEIAMAKNWKPTLLN